MAITNSTTGIYALKEFYDGQKIENVTQDASPLYKMLKRKQIGGKYWPLPVIHSNTAVGGDFSVVQGLVRASTGVSFQIDTSEVFSVARITGKAKRESQAAGKNAFGDLLETEVDSAFRRCSERLSQQLYGTRTGSLGACGTVTTSVTLPVSSRYTLQNIQVGDFIVFSATDGSAVLGTTPGQAVTGIDMGALELTGAVEWDNAAIAAVTGYQMYLRGGAYDNGDGPESIQGLPGWCPASAPGATTFFSVARDVDESLAGWRVTGSSSVEDTLIDMAAAVFENRSGRCSHFVLNPQDYSTLEKELQGRAQYDKTKTEGGYIGSDGIKVASFGGMALAIADPYCPQSSMWGFNIENLWLASLGAPIGFLDHGLNGKGLDLVGTEDQLELRVGGYNQFACNRPSTLVYGSIA